VGNLVRGGAACVQCVFKAMMEKFTDAIGLSMECFGVYVGNVEQMRKTVPEGGNKLRSAVTSDCVRRPKREIQVEQRASAQKWRKWMEEVLPQPSVQCGQ
jgi:hypothetical protein